MTTYSYKDPLRLTSPYAKGDRVKEAQKLLAGDGKVLKKKCYHGAIDGQYGPQCAGATKHAKYWLGYPNKKCNTVFGETLYEYLTGKKKLTAFMKWRIRHRKKIAAKRAKQGGLYGRSIRLAIHFLGVKESPFGSNRQMFGAWYGANGVPWCAIFVSYILSHCKRYFHQSYVPFIVELARQGEGNLRVIPYSAVPECIKNGHPVLAAYDWNHDGTADHIEFIEHVLNSTQFTAIGGNTGPVDFSNGGEVMRSTRFTSVVQAYIEVYQ